MAGCSAPNCSNSTTSKDPSKRKTKRVFIFPADINRRQRWIQNCRRDKWIIKKSAYLCEDHFEESQFESSRADGWRKLKPNAIPTLFNVPNPPKLLQSQRIKGVGMPKNKKIKLDTPDTSTSTIAEKSESDLNESATVLIQDLDYEALQRRIQELEAEKNKAQESYEKLEESYENWDFGAYLTCTPSSCT